MEELSSFVCFSRFTIYAALLFFGPSLVLLSLQIKPTNKARVRSRGRQERRGKKAAETRCRTHPLLRASPSL